MNNPEKQIRYLGICYVALNLFSIGMGLLFWFLYHHPFLPAAIILFSFPGLIAGYGLLKHRPWSRVLAIVMGIFNMLSFPFGTAIGIYAIVVLFSDQAKLILSPPNAV